MRLVTARHLRVCSRDISSDKQPPSDEGGAEQGEAEGEITTPPSFATQNPPPLTRGGFLLQNLRRCAIILVAHLLFWGVVLMECMLHDKKKRIIAICCSAFHIIMLFPRLCPRLVALIQNFEHIAINHLITTLLPIVTPILALVFFLTYKKEYRLKRWLLPLAFGTAAIHSVVSLLSSSSSIMTYSFTTPNISYRICVRF